MSQYAIAALSNQNRALHQRLSRIEALVAKIEFDSTGVHVKPNVDPSPVDYARIDRFSDFAMPGSFTDPAPDDFTSNLQSIYSARLIDLLHRWKGGFTDPSPNELARIRLSDLVAIAKFPIPKPGDPGPEEIGHLSRVELEGQLHRVSAELVRLRDSERMIKQRLDGMAATSAKS